jgi:hypothetical protein
MSPITEGSIAKRGPRHLRFVAPPGKSTWHLFFGGRQALCGFVLPSNGVVVIRELNEERPEPRCQECLASIKNTIFGS